MPKKNAMNAAISRTECIIKMYAEIFALNQLVATNWPSREQVEAMTMIQIEAVRREAVCLQNAFRDLPL